MSFFCWKKDDEVTPVKPRGCTDIFCLAIFFVFWAVLIFLASFAFVVGNPMRLIHGYDSFGNICGMKNEPLGNLPLSGLNMTSKPFVFYLNTHNIGHSLKICTEKCPDERIDNIVELHHYEREAGVKLCRYDYDPENPATPTLIEQEIGAGPCPKMPLYPTKVVMNRCVPEALHDVGEAVLFNVYSYLNSIDVVQQVVSDLYAGWYEILWMIFVAVGLAFMMVFLIHYLAAIVSWIFMAIVGASLIMLTAVLWWTYADIKYDLDSIPFAQLLEESAQNERAFLTFSVLCTIITVIILLIMLVMRRRVQLVIALFQEAGRCIRAMPCLLIQPLWTFIVLLIFFVFWIFVLVALATADYPKKNNLDMALLNMHPEHSEDAFHSPTDVRNKSISLTLVSYSEPSWVHYMWWYHVIALLWTSEFILGCQQMVIAGAVASWYFTRDRDNLRCPIIHSIRRLTLYHMGSVAMGSFLIMLFKIPRLILTYVQSKLKKHEKYAMARWCLCLCQCFLLCLEKFLKYLNHNAYTVIAIEGANFCTSAQVAFNAIVTNALRVAAINSVGDFILFLGKCGVTALTAFIGILIMKHNPELHFYAVPVLVITLFAFFISHCVLSVYEMVIDTLFLCFCEDYNKNDGTPGREYYAPQSLLEFMHQSSAEGESAIPLNAVSRSEDAEVESIQQE